MRSRYWAITGLWLVYGVLNATLVYSRAMLFGKPMAWLDTFFYEVSFTLVWAGVTPLILSLAERYPFVAERWWRPLLAHTGGTLLTATVTKVFWDFSALPFLEPSLVPTSFEMVAQSIVRALDFSFLHYAIVLVGWHAWDYHRRYEDGRLRASQLEARLATAQLQALKMQLHPHFLFNTLHSISELVHDDPPKAERMIVGLSDFLRMTLDQVGQSEVSLGEELDFLGRYLEIEQMRFEDRLQVVWDVEAKVRRARVPNLILQPMVENALKHGIGQITTQGVLRISCAQSGDRLRMSVRDNGPGPRQKVGSGREGVGFANTRSRLEKHYGGNHHIETKRAEGGGFVVTLTIPFRPIPEQQEAK
jgi:two-component system, LytTR family, sensor kinase